jgi:hypothetical protein
VARPYGGALQTLDAIQSAPALFLMGERAVVLIGGNSELALRFLPFVAGGATVVVMWRLADRLLDRISVPLAVSLTAVSPLLIRYSNEVKPYVMDAFFAAILFLLTLQLIESGSDRAWRRWAICGAVAVASSMAAPFTLVAVAFTVLFRRWSEDRLKCLLRISIAGAAWLALFVTQYALQYRFKATDGFVQSYFSGQFLELAFPEFFQTAGLAFRTVWLATVLGNDMEAWLPPKSTSVVIGIALIGFVSLARKHPVAVAMLVGQGIAAAAASMLHRWPLIDRLLLFAAPSAILFTAAGFGQLVRLAPAKLRTASALVIGAMLLAFPTLDAIRKTLTPPSLADTPAAIAELARQQTEGETVYVFAKAQVECSFYTGDLATHNPTCTLPFARLLRGAWPPEYLLARPGETIAAVGGGWAEQEAQRILDSADGRFWLLSSDAGWQTDLVGSALARRGAVLEQRYDWQGAQLIRYRVENNGNHGEGSLPVAPSLGGLREGE